MRKTLFLLLFSLLTFFVKAQRTDHISSNVDKLTPEIIDAWKLVYDARPTDCYRRDFPLLQNITAFKKSTQLWNWIGNDAGLKIILQKNVNAPCPSCVSCEQPKYPYLNRMSEYIADVGHLYRYQDKGGIQIVLNTLKGLDRNGKEADTDENAKWALEGTAFMIRCIRENFTATGQLLPIVEFEKYYAKQGNMATFRYADIVMSASSPVNIKLIECKSWFINGKNFTDLTQGQGNAYGQFLDYLNNPAITSLNQLEYWFDKRKASESGIKLKFQAMFKNKAQDIFEKVTPSKLSILFGRIDSAEDLKTKANDLTSSNSIYRFIHAK